jgi:hypothetical protein
MNLKTATLLLIFLSSLEPAHAQQELTKSYVNTIQIFGGERFYMNHKKLPFAELRSMLLRFNSSAVEFNTYIKKARPAAIALLIGTAAGVIALAKLKKDSRFLTPYSITLFVGDLIGIPLMISANKYLRRSVKRYNAEVLK